MRTSLFGLLLLSTLAASGNEDVYMYNYWGKEQIKNYAAEISTSVYAHLPSPNDGNKCLPMYKNAIANGVLDVRYALGYFDDSQGIDILWNGKNWGLSPSLDIGIYNSIRNVLSEPCTSPSQVNLCGFEQSGDPDSGKVYLEKRIQLLNNNVLVRIALTHASASESYVLNVNEMKSRQSFLTAQSEENYFGGIGKADIVIYNGHSRDGGGPDFNPPILDKTLHTDYQGYYHKKRIGIKRVLELVKQGTNKDSILTFFSCYSRKHFYDVLMKANPKQRLILSAETIDYFDTLKASVGYLEGFMRGACGQELADIAKQGEKLRSGFQGYQLR